MKKLCKIAGTLAALAIIFSFTACQHDPDDGGKPDNSPNPVKPVINVSLSRLNDMEYKPGTEAEPLSVSAAKSDGGTLSYQWYVSDSETAAGTSISGARSASYTPPIPPTLPGGTDQVKYYYVVITNTLGSKTATETSRRVKITASENAVEHARPPLIEPDNPADAAYNPGATATPLTVDAESPDGGTLSYQWYKSDSEDGDGEAISDETDESYTPPIPATLDGPDVHTWYWVVVTNTNNDVDGEKTASLASRRARITVTNDEVENAETPNITTHPQSAVYTRIVQKEDDIEPLTVEHDPVSDGGDISYEWFHAETDGGHGTVIPGETGASFTPPFTPGIIYYYVEVVNENKAVNGNERGIAKSEYARIEVKNPELPLVYKVVGTPSGTSSGAVIESFVGTFKVGGTVSVAAGPSANIGPAYNNSSLYSVRTHESNNNGYIALGDKVGQVLKTLETWTMETYVYIPDGVATADSGANNIWAFGYTDDYKSANTNGGIGPTMWLGSVTPALRIRSVGWSTAAGPWLDTDTPPTSDIRGRWRHIALVMDTNSVLVYRDGSLVSRGPISTSTMLKTTDLDQFNFGYLGRSIFHANGDAAIKSTEFYQFAVYEGAMTQTQILDDLDVADTLFALNGDHPPVTGFSFVFDPDVTAAGATVGSVTAVAGGMPPYTYDLVSGDGDGDNGLFTMSGADLRVGGAALDGTMKSVRIGVTDTYGTTYEQSFRIGIVAPVLWYNFDNETGGSVLDKTGSYTGTLQNSATIETYGSVSALSFAPGGDQWFDLSAAAGDLIAGAAIDEFTISTYVYVGPTSATGWGDTQGWNIFSFTADGTIANNRAGINYRVGQDNANVNHELDMATANQNRNWLTRGSGAWFAKNEWKHIVYTHVNGDGNTNSIGTLYLDGVLVNTKVDTFRTDRTDGGTMGTLANNWLGRPSFGTNYMKDTKYADFRIYDEAFSASDVAALYIKLGKDYSDLDEVPVDYAITSVTASLGDLSAVISDLTLPDTMYGVSVNWSSDTPAVISNTGVVTRPHFDAAGDATVTLTATFTKGDITKTETFTVTVPKLLNPVEVKIRKAEVALGDLSTVDANVTLPESDATVTVSWVSSNPSVFSNDGEVTRPSGSPAELTLTGTFTSVEYPTLIEVRVWNVRVMQTGAVPEDYLNVHYVVEDGEFINIAPSGTFYTPLLTGAATIVSDKSPTGYRAFIDLGGGYIDLGPKVGSLLRQPEWTIEFLINLESPNDTGTMISFANDANINTTTAGSWRGTFHLTSGAMMLRALYNGAAGATAGTADNPTGTGVATGGSLGVDGRTNQWMRMAIIKRADGTAKIMRNYGRAQNNSTNTGYAALTTNATFGSGDPELEDFRFGYLGKSVLDGVGQGTSNSAYYGASGAYIYEFKAYSKAMPLDGSDSYPNQTALRAVTTTMNNAFRTGNTGDTRFGTADKP